MPAFVPRRLRRRVVYPFVALGRAGLARLPRPVACAGADLAARAAWHLLPRDRHRMAENLAVAFPELSEGERRAIGRAAFRHFGRVFVDAARLPAMTDADLAELVRFHDPTDVLGEVKRRGRGAIGITAHLGHWELLVACLARRGMPCKAIAKRLRDDRLHDMVVALRGASGVGTITRDEGTRPILRALREGFTLGLLIDQDTDVDGDFVPFFGRPAFTTRAPGVLHLATGAPVFTAFCLRAPDGRYDAYVEPILPPAPPGLSGEAKAAASRAIVAEATRRIEAAVRRHPEQWVWWHRRWKTQPEGAGELGAPLG